MRRFIFGLFVAVGFLFLQGGVFAESISSSITLTGIVPEMRFVYLDQNGYVSKVIVNTPNNITPRVISANNKEAPMTESIMKQYDYFMALHSWKLKSGISYNVNPVQINTETNQQSISINSQPLLVSKDLQLQAGATPVFGQTG